MIEACHPNADFKTHANPAMEPEAYQLLARCVPPAPIAVLRQDLASANELLREVF